MSKQTKLKRKGRIWVFLPGNELREFNSYSDGVNRLIKHGDIWWVIQKRWCYTEYELAYKKDGE